MESLVAIFGELSYKIIFPVLLVSGLATISFLSFGLDLIIRRSKKSKAGQVNSDLTNNLETNIVKSPLVIKIFKSIKWISTIFTGVFLLLLLLLNTILFTPAVNWVLDNVYAKKKIKISYDKVSGNIFTGELKFSGLHLKRIGDRFTNFDLNIRKVYLNINYSSAIRRKIALKYMSFEGVSGELTRVRIKPWYLRKRRDFTVTYLTAKDIKINIINHYIQTGIKKVSLKIVKVESRDFQRKYAALDLFFKSNLQGSINGKDVKIQTETVNGARKTLWVVHNLSVPELRIIVNKKLAWLESGHVNIEVVHSWKNNYTKFFDSSWKIRLIKLKARMPDNATRLKKVFLKPLVSYLSKGKEERNLNFGMQLNEDSFVGHASLDATKLWRSVMKSAIQELSGGLLGRIVPRLRKFF